MEAKSRKQKNFKQKFGKIFQTLGVQTNAGGQMELITQVSGLAIKPILNKLK